MIGRLSCGPSTDERHRPGRHDLAMSDENTATRPPAAVAAYGMPAPARRGWPVPAGLVALSTIPVLAGAARLTQLAAGVRITPDNARFFASPTPVVLHIVCVSVYSVLGAFQFAGGLRRRRPGWHRMAGRVLILCGLGTALTGIWMTLFYPRPDDVGDLLSGIRLVVGSAVFGSIILGFAAIRRRDIARHRAWMMRGYAIAMGAGTQAVTQLPVVVFVGRPGVLAKAMLMAAAWLVNIAVAEWIIRRRPVNARGARVRPAGGAAVRLSRQPSAGRAR